MKQKTFYFQNNSIFNFNKYANIDRYRFSSIFNGKKIIGIVYFILEIQTR